VDAQKLKDTKASSSTPSRAIETTIEALLCTVETNPQALSRFASHEGLLDFTITAEDRATLKRITNGIMPNDPSAVVLMLRITLEFGRKWKTAYTVLKNAIKAAKSPTCDEIVEIARKLQCVVLNDGVIEVLTGKSQGVSLTAPQILRIIDNRLVGVELAVGRLGQQLEMFSLASGTGKKKEQKKEAAYEAVLMKDPAVPNGTVMLKDTLADGTNDSLVTDPTGVFSASVRQVGEQVDKDTNSPLSKDPVHTEVGEPNPPVPVKADPEEIARQEDIKHWQTCKTEYEQLKRTLQSPDCPSLSNIIEEARNSPNRDTVLVNTEVLEDLIWLNGKKQRTRDEVLDIVSNKLGVLEATIAWEQGKLVEYVKSSRTTKPDVETVSTGEGLSRFPAPNALDLTATTNGGAWTQDEMGITPVAEKKKKRRKRGKKKNIQTIEEDIAESGVLKSLENVHKPTASGPAEVAQGDSAELTQTPSPETTASDGFLIKSLGDVEKGRVWLHDRTLNAMAMRFLNFELSILNNPSRGAIYILHALTTLKLHTTQNLAFAWIGNAGYVIGKGGYYGPPTEPAALLKMPNSIPDPCTLTREQEEHLIRLHIRPLILSSKDDGGEACISASEVVSDDAMGIVPSRQIGVQSRHPSGDLTTARHYEQMGKMELTTLIDQPSTYMIVQIAGQLRNVSSDQWVCNVQPRRPSPHPMHSPSLDCLIHICRSFSSNRK
jgi:hypothetical protein